MSRVKSFKAGGIALLGFGAVIMLIGLSGGAPACRIAGPVVGFLGVVLLAQATRDSE